jgi:hypothetical protein
MKERGILFSAPMVRAILDGSKTQTRRAVAPKAKELVFDLAGAWTDGPANSQYLHVPSRHKEDPPGDTTSTRIYCPYGQPGDRLWVRETWQYYDWTEDGEPCIRYAANNATAWPEPPNGEAIVDEWEILSRPENYSIDNHARDRRWRPSIFMPRWASRILLEIAAVRVERLQDIREADALAEGVPGFLYECYDFDMKAMPPAVANYRRLWNEINGPGSWDANPWVWVVEFKRRDLVSAA